VVTAQVRRSFGKPAPLLGEHNEEVLQTFLGMNSQVIDKLYKQGILVQDLEPEQPV
jgi:crotonobetainyl-CoA:carnitine CoA-transferase CaiB-like acyl-CoA transferase